LGRVFSTTRRVEGLGEALGAHRAREAALLGAVLLGSLDEHLLGVVLAVRQQGPVVVPGHRSLPLFVPVTAWGAPTVPAVVTDAEETEEPRGHDAIREKKVDKSPTVGSAV
jgi:hypothetical protein